MRVLNLDGPKARYERLRLLKDAKDFGLELDPKSTAPFTVSWCREISGPEVTFRRTRLAMVDTRPGRPTAQLRILDQYPEDKDAALIRALENAADLTDEVGRLKRAEAAEAKTKAAGPKLFAKGPGVGFTITGYTPTAFMQALCGADGRYGGVFVEDFDPLRPPPQTRVRFRRSNTWETETFTLGAGTLTYEAGRYDQYHLKEEPFRGLLADGARYWDANIRPDALAEACASVVRATPDTDWSLRTSYNYAENYALLAPCAGVRLGAMSCDPKFTVRFHGVILAREGDMGRLLRPMTGLGVEEALINDAVNAMRLRMRAARLGARVEDFPVVDPDMIRDAIDSTDTGHFL